MRCRPASLIPVLLLLAAHADAADIWELIRKDRAVEVIKFASDVKVRDQKNEEGETPLMFAVALGHEESTKGLLKAKADLQAHDSRGFTVLHRAVKDRKSTRLNSSHVSESRMPSSA